MSREPSSFAYQFGDWIVEPQLNRVRRNGVEKKFEPKAVAVLQHLLDRPGEVVSIDELLDAVWAGRVVEPNALHRHITRLRQALGDDPHNAEFIETVSKRGYRVIAQVRRLGSGSVANPASPAAATKWQLHYKLLLATVGVLLLGLGAWWLVRGNGTSTNFTAPPATVKQKDQSPVLPNSVAVLPLENLSPDPDNNYFAAGVHEEILNQLAKVRDLSVIARTSVQKYADTTLTIPEIAAELNVQSVLEGSVRYADDRVRITAQLVDSTTGAHLWSETYDRELADILAIQSEVATQIANTLDAKLSSEERYLIEAIPTTNMGAYLRYVRALTMLQDFPPLDPVHAVLDQAIELDPTFAAAVGLKAFLYANQANTPLQKTAITPENLERYVGLAKEYANRAEASDPTVAITYVAKAGIAEREGNMDDALTEITKAYRLNPNQPFVRLIFARALAIRGSPDAPRMLEATLAHDPQNAGMFLAVSRYYSEMGNPARSHEVIKQAVELAPGVATYTAELAGWEAARGAEDRALHYATRAEALHQPSTPTSTLDAQLYLQLIVCYQALDRREDALRLVAKLEAMETGRVPELLAGAYMTLGETDKAVAQFQKALDEGYPWIQYELAFHRNHPKFDLLREHPGFLKMLDQVPPAN